jgi:hypothetical protein
MLRSFETLQEMLRQESEDAPPECAKYMVQVATHPDVTLLALELALHTWHTIACVPSASKMPPRELAQYELNYLYNPIRLSRDSFYVNQYLFFAALHAAGLVSDLNLGCSLAQSNGVVVLSLGAQAHSGFGAALR